MQVILSQFRRVQAHFGSTENHRKYPSAESGSNGSSVAQEPEQIQLRQVVPQLLDKRKPRQAQPAAVGGGWSRGQAGRPPGRPPWPIGPTASTLPCGASSLAPNVGSVEKSCDLGVAPSYKYNGRGRGMNTHITPSQLTFLPWSLRPSS